MALIKKALIKSLAVSLGLLSWFTYAAAETVVIYRWVDANNVVHFSQHQPEHDNYTEITMAQSKKSVSNTPNDNDDSADTTPADNNGPSTAEKSIVAARMSERCQEAKTNVATLTNYDDVQYADANGETKVLTAEEKRQQLALSQRQVEVYCEQ